MDFSKRARCHWNCFGDGPPTRRLVVLLSLFVFANAAVLSAADATDFDLDGDSDIDDLNTLLARGPLVVGYIVEPGAMDPFDLTADGFVNDQDLAEWLVIAADVNELSLPYKEGDANLDGTVDGDDFLVWHEARFTSTLRWDNGDFNCDGFADGSDFLLWNRNKFTTSLGLISVPEPCGGTISSILICCQLALLSVATRR